MTSSTHSHKPRRRNKFDQDAPTHSPSLHNGVSSQLEHPSFPLASFFWPSRGNLSKWSLLPIVFLTTGLYRWSASLWPYSGYHAPPMHGDFEAQRHWMEITIHLPASHWYFHDLQWWGLDYPPLTAYHSWLLGKIGSAVDPSWFQLHSSRGLDDPGLKTYMRATVLASEYLTLVPALIFFVRRFSSAHRVSSWEASIALMAIMMQPGLILIDHAHFQYNTVMLGFIVACLACMLGDRYFWSCVFFVAALGFKQMTLYYAPIVFAFLLGSCVFPRLRIDRFLGISIVTMASFIALFVPLVAGVLFDIYRGVEFRDMASPPLFAATNLSERQPLGYIILQLAQTVHRIFPFARGLFEDKVANFWCAAHTFYKLKHFPAATLQQVSLAATVLSILPASTIIFLRPYKSLVPLAFASTAWGFFLFSFQVHEKSVLLPLMPMTLLLAGEDGLRGEMRAWVGWATLLSCWTMFPLLVKDGLRVPYYALTILWGWLVGEPSGLRMLLQQSRPDNLHWTTSMLHSCFYIAMIGWHIGEAFIPPPVTKPDIWVVLNVLIGAAGFGICYLWCLGSLYQASAALACRQTKIKAV